VIEKLAENKYNYEQYRYSRFKEQVDQLLIELIINKKCTKNPDHLNLLAKAIN